MCVRNILVFGDGKASMRRRVSLYDITKVRIIVFVDSNTRSEWEGQIIVLLGLQHDEKRHYHQRFPRRVTFNYGAPKRASSDSLAAESGMGRGCKYRASPLCECEHAALNCPPGLHGRGNEDRQMVFHPCECGCVLQGWWFLW